MASHQPTLSQIGLEAMNGGYFMAGGGGGGGGGTMSADVPPFHPCMLLDHGGFGFGLGDAAAGGGATATELGAQLAANNLMLASFAGQLFRGAPAPRQDGHGGARTPPEEEMDGGYGVAGGDSCGAGQSGAKAAWSSPSLHGKPYGGWSDGDMSHHLAGLPDAAAGFHSPLAAGGRGGSANAAAASELSLALCTMSSSDGALNAAAADRCSSAANRSALYLRARPTPVHFAAAVARSRYAAAAQEALNDFVGRLLDGAAEAAAAADSRSGVDSGEASAVSSNKLLASSGAGAGADAAARWGEARSVEGDLLKMLHLMDQKYNQCVDEVQSTVAKFNSLVRGGGGGSICAPFAHGAVSAMYRGLRRRVVGEIVAAASRPGSWGESSSVTGAGGEIESALLKKHWAAQRLRRQEQQCWRPRRGLPEDSVAVLKAWMFEHFLKPYPDDHEKDVLAARSCLTRNQVSNWFINARVRLWKPLIEEMLQETKRRSGEGQGSAMEQCVS
ncbi:hypothetical protein ACP4OV_009964 [Aristida adscensionis]